MKSILFKPDMIPAIVDGRKTQTRRLDGLKEINQEPDKWRLIYRPVPNKPDYFENGREGKFIFCEYECFGERRLKPRYQAGDVVYIKEAWQIAITDSESGCYAIRYSDGTEVVVNDHSTLVNYFSPNIYQDELEKKRSPMFMPEWAARYFIKIQDVRPERLQDITDEDAVKEGIMVKAVTTQGTQVIDEPSFVNAYAMLWDSVNPKQDWASNPWCWRICFVKIDKLVGIVL